MGGTDEMFFEMMSTGEDGADENSREHQTGAASFDVPASQDDGANASSDATHTGDISFELPTRQDPSSRLRRRLPTFHEVTELAITGPTDHGVGWVQAGFTQPLESSVQIENEAPNDTSERKGTILEVEAEEDEGDAANNRNNNPDAHLLQLGEQSSSIGFNDLFPHLDRLGSHLYFVQLVPEACRLIYHHSRCFLYPALFLALSIALTCVQPQSGNPQCGDTLDISSFISYAISLVLSSLAEVGCHRAVVRVYLRKRYGTQMSSSSSGNFFGAALSCIGSALAAMTVMALCSTAYYTCLWFFSIPEADERIILLTYGLNSRMLSITGDFVFHAARGTFHLPKHAVLAYLGGAVPRNVAAGSVYSHFLVILPTSALTTLWGFRAVGHSLSLLRFVRSFNAWGMVCMISVVLTMLPRLLTGQFDSASNKELDSSYFLAAMIVWVWILSLVGLLARTLLYLKVRAMLKSGIPGRSPLSTPLELGNLCPGGRCCGRFASISNSWDPSQFLHTLFHLLLTSHQAFFIYF